MLIWFLTWAHSAMHSPQHKSTTIPLKNGNFGSQMYHLYNDFFFYRLHLVVCQIKQNDCF